ncbi:predicted protein [Plenodomus lingam JN3]|uniref:Predicted protein n=1 Tax=Leptosphaeria maculans (strain JN3 / isolate v23.1.3 / race Av1-4-5-6-7-8) TaxID=985895 RepID=E5A3C8_LEPMJ|nr:predicted protein [Plenodomus lingam JN3]CBX98141.1 predicted protein [Plenodomus lingam JN3]
MAGKTVATESAIPSEFHPVTPEYSNSVGSWMKPWTCNRITIQGRSKTGGDVETLRWGDESLTLIVNRTGHDGTLLPELKALGVDGGSRRTGISVVHHRRQAFAGDAVSALMMITLQDLILHIWGAGGHRLHPAKLAPFSMINCPSGRTDGVNRNAFRKKDVVDPVAELTEGSARPASWVYRARRQQTGSRRRWKPRMKTEYEGHDKGVRGSGGRHQR